MNSSEAPDSRRLFWIVIFGIILYIVLDVIAQVLPPHYSPISQAESDLAVGQYGLIMTINFLNRGILSLLFIYAFFKTLDLVKVDRQQFRSGTYLLGAWAVGAILLAIFPDGEPSTGIFLVHGGVHLVIAIIAFIGGAFGALIISRKLRKVRELQGLSRIAMPLSIIAVILWFIEFLPPFILPHLNAYIGGLTERLFIGSVLLWIAAVSAYIATHSNRLKKEMSK